MYALCWAARPQVRGPQGEKTGLEAAATAYMADLTGII